MLNVVHSLRDVCRTSRMRWDQGDISDIKYPGTLSLPKENKVLFLCRSYVLSLFKSYLFVSYTCTVQCLYVCVWGGGWGGGCTHVRVYWCIRPTHTGWMDERCFRPLLCTVKAELGQGQPGLMRWIWDETLPRAVSIARPSTLQHTALPSELAPPPPPFRMHTDTYLIM